MINHALQYAAMGWAVIPLHNIQSGKCSCKKPDCSSPGKHPRTKNGLKDATTDNQTITNWWHKWHDANIGIVTGKISGLVVLDVDPAHGGMDSFNALLNDRKPISTIIQLTGGNGYHYLFNYPANTPSIKNSAGKLGPGLDVRADGGYIVVSPSNHKSGQIYRWQDHEISESSLQDMPDWLLDALTITNKPPKQSGQHHEIIPEGYRNNALTKLAGKLWASGISKKELEIRLLEENRLKCLPPLPDTEVSRIAGSIACYQNKSKPFVYQWRDLVLSEKGPHSPTTRYLLLALASHMNKEGGSCYPTQEQLIKETGLTKKTISKHCQVAANDGWIEIYEHQGNGQAYRNYGYIAKMPESIKNLGNLLHQVGAANSTQYDELGEPRSNSEEPDTL